MSTTERQEAPLLMTQGEAAALLGVSRNTIVRLVRQGELSKIHLSPGSRARVRRDEVLALVDRRGDSP